MRIAGHLAGGFLVSKKLVDQMELTSSERIAFLKLGTFLGVLPDLDYFIYAAKKGSFVFDDDFQHHKWITHTFPFYIIPGRVIYLYGTLSGNDRLRKLSILFVSSTCLHILQDMIGTGDGIKWAWPFSQRMDGICLLNVHGKDWVDTYSRHPISWVERAFIIVALFTLFYELFINPLE